MDAVILREWSQAARSTARRAGSRRISRFASSVAFAGWRACCLHAWSASSQVATNCLIACSSFCIRPPRIRAKTKGRAKLFADFCRLQGTAALETFLRPVGSAFVILLHRRYIGWEHHPGLLRRGEYMNVRRKPIWLIERADTDKAHGVACSAVEHRRWSSRAAARYLESLRVRQKVSEPVGRSDKLPAALPVFAWRPKRCPSGTWLESRSLGNRREHCRAGNNGRQRQRKDAAQAVCKAQRKLQSVRTIPWLARRQRDCHRPYCSRRGDTISASLNSL